jgi:hypothetical protein
MFICSKPIRRLPVSGDEMKKRTIPSASYETPVKPDNSPYTEEDMDLFAGKIRYEGNPRHKKSPGSFGLESTVKPYHRKALCDVVSVKTSREAIWLLKEGIRRKLVSLPDPRPYELKWPKCIWAVKDDIVLEARHTGNGVYHGYPELSTQALGKIVKELWEKNA